MMKSASMDDSPSDELGVSHFLIEDDIYNGHKSSSKKKKIIISVVALLLVALLILLLAFLIPRSRSNDDNHNIKPKKPLNVIFLIGDGFGPAAATMARYTNEVKNNVTALNLDRFVTGTVKTYSASSWITDSAAGATAYATGHKTFNEAVSVDPVNKKPLGTIFEAAIAKGIRTGVAVTTRISDATPAGFFSHSVSRHDEAFIISQLLEKNLTVALGGGGMYFNQNVYSEAANSSHNYQVVTSREAMLNVTSGKLLGVFQNYNMPYEIDRINQKLDVPTLNEMATKAIELVNQDNENGFLLMLEGSQIDVAAHANDAAAQIYETWQFDQTFKTAIDFAKRDGNTIIVVTADHETGGITLGIQQQPHVYPDYAWYPEVLLKFTASVEWMANQLFNTTQFPKLNETIITDFINQHYTNTTKITFTTEEMDLLLSFTTPTPDVEGFKPILGRTLSRRANVGFTTSGHTGVDVNLYYFYSGEDEDVREARPFGNIQNTDVANFIAKVMELDLEEQTAKYSNFVPSPPTPPSP